MLSNPLTLWTAEEVSMVTVFCRSVTDAFHFPAPVEYGMNYADAGAFSDTAGTQHPHGWRGEGAPHRIVRTHHPASCTKGGESEDSSVFLEIKFLLLGF